MAQNRAEKGPALLATLAVVGAAVVTLAYAARALPSMPLLETAEAQAETDRYAQRRLTFADEFDTLDLRRGDTGVWTTSFGYGGIDNFTLTNNRELQLYVDPEFKGSGGQPLGLQPFGVRDGILDIAANRTPDAMRRRMWRYRFYSGLLTTRQSFSQQYGYFEIRARLPSTHGAWPAFWLLPANGSWPPEIDVMEHLGREPNVYYAGYHANPGGRREGGAAPVEIRGPEGQFHTYGVLWDEAHVTWFLDGARVRQIRTPEDMHTPMYLLINLAIGGRWARNPTMRTQFPARMSVDYVRVYALDPAEPR